MSRRDFGIVRVADMKPPEGGPLRNRPNETPEQASDRHEALVARAKALWDARQERKKGKRK